MIEVKADGLVKPATGLVEQRKRAFETDDIVALVNEVEQTDRDDTEVLSRMFEPTLHGLKKLFDFMRVNFHYQEDFSGNQSVRTPSYFFKTRVGDCKSYTVFICSVLHNMGLKRIIRYTSYGTKKYRHVYPIAILPNGRRVILDVVYAVQEGGQFGEEKKFTKKKDFHVKAQGLYKLGNTSMGQDTGGLTHLQARRLEAQMNEMESAMSDIPDEIISQGPGDVTEMTSGELDRYLMAERLQAQADHEKDPRVRNMLVSGKKAVQSGQISGIGSLGDPRFVTSLSNFIDDTKADNRRAIELPKLAIQQGASVSGLFKKIGGLFKKLFKKLMNFIFKGPGKLMGPYFLFLYLGGKAVGKVREITRRRKSQEKTYSWIKKVGKFDDRKLNSLIEIGIKKQTGHDPKSLLRKAGAGNAIGAIPVAVLIKGAKVASIVITVIKKMKNVFKKGGDTGSPSAQNGSDLRLLDELQPSQSTGNDSSRGTQTLPNPGAGRRIPSENLTRRPSESGASGSFVPLLFAAGGAIALLSMK